MIYLDNAATTQISPQVLEAMMPYLKEEYGNAGSIYSLGRRAADAIAKARQQVADFIGAKPEQIIFTSGGTEANNLAILGCRDYLSRIGKRHIVTTPIEHDSVLRTINSFCKPLSCNDKKCIKEEFYTSFLPINKYGYVSPRDLEQRLDSYGDIGLVSMMYINNEIGTVNPVTQIGELCKKKCTLFLTDCVQAAGQTLLDVNRLMCDLMTISAHKIHAPKGVGALYVKDRQYLTPVINGGSEQEFGLRGGTENVSSIVGFGQACELASRNMRDNNKNILNCKKYFYNLLRYEFSKNNLDGEFWVNGNPVTHNGKVLSLTFKNVDAETLVLLMDTKGICISAGSACTSHESKPSHVLKAIGLSDDDARSTIRISFSESSKPYEMEIAARILANCVNTLRGVGV